MSSGTFLLTSGIKANVGTQPSTLLDLCLRHAFWIHCRALSETLSRYVFLPPTHYD